MQDNKLTPWEEYFNKLHEVGKRGIVEWIGISPRIAQKLNQIKNGRKRSKSW
jgi:hypothetical protein